MPLGQRVLVIREHDPSRGETWMLFYTVFVYSFLLYYYFIPSREVLGTLGQRGIGLLQIYIYFQPRSKSTVAKVKHDIHYSESLAQCQRRKVGEPLIS